MFFLNYLIINKLNLLKKEVKNTPSTSLKLINEIKITYL